MNRINSFSMSRSLQLVRMELNTRYKQVITFSIFALGVLVLFPLMGGVWKIDYQVYPGGVESFFAILFFALFAFGIFYYITMNKRIRISDTIAYSSIPSTTGEKYLSIIILAFLHLFMGWVVAQLSLLLLEIINPSILIAMREMNDTSAPLRIIAGVPVFYPMIIFAYKQQVMLWLIMAYFIYFLIAQKSSFGWNATTWWEKIIILIFVNSVIVPISLANNDVEIPKELLSSYYWVMTIAFFVGGYFKLRKIEQL